jgi:hypothetical protein
VLPRGRLLPSRRSRRPANHELHICGFAALERGFNLLTFDGPGQPTVVREQGLGFRHDWEQVVTPVVNACEAIPEIDASRLD